MESISLSTLYDARYVIMDSETGEIVDECQGWGYTTAQKAHKGFAYKLKTGEIHNDN